MKDKTIVQNYSDEMRTFLFLKENFESKQVFTHITYNLDFQLSGTNSNLFNNAFIVFIALIIKPHRKPKTKVYQKVTYLISHETNF